MDEEVIDEAKATARQLRPLVITVVAAKLAVTVLLLTTVQHAPPLSEPEIVALR